MFGQIDVSSTARKKWNLSMIYVHVPISNFMHVVVVVFCWEGSHFLMCFLPLTYYFNKSCKSVGLFKSQSSFNKSLCTILKLQFFCGFHNIMKVDRFQWMRTNRTKDQKCSSCLTYLSRGRHLDHYHIYKSQRVNDRYSLIHQQRTKP